MKLSPFEHLINDILNYSSVTSTFTYPGRLSIGERLRLKVVVKKSHTAYNVVTGVTKIWL